MFNASAIRVMVDRWRPETHSFHLSCSEMTVTNKAKPIKTHMGSNDHLDLDMGVASVDQKVYYFMFGSLLYLCASKLDIMLGVYMCIRF
jgi:hypothetical protein